MSEKHNAFCSHLLFNRFLSKVRYIFTLAIFLRSENVAFKKICKVPNSHMDFLGEESVRFRRHSAFSKCIPVHHFPQEER